MKLPTHLTLAVALTACGGSEADELVPGPSEGACAPSELLGRFEVALDDGFTSVQGKVDDLPSPLRAAQVVLSEGNCHVMAPPDIFCPDGCGAGEVCGNAGQCVAEPVGMSVGTVTIAGLRADISMEASAPVFFYSHRGELPHPAAAEGDSVVLRASGGDLVPAFALAGTGIAELESAMETLELAEGSAAEISWIPGADANTAEMLIELNIAQHGGTPGWITCAVPDTGSATIPEALVTSLVQRGFSGFPSLSLQRRSVDSELFATGCIEFALQSQRTFEVSLPGLTSCSSTEDCPEGQSCQPDLTCGP